MSAPSYAWDFSFLWGYRWLILWGLWVTILFLVTLQMTTYLRPILWRAPGQPLFEAEKKSFFSHLHDVSEWKPKPATTPIRAGAAAREPRR